MKITQEIRDWFRIVGSKGGRTRARRLSKARRVAIASLGGKARKARFDALKKSTGV